MQDKILDLLSRGLSQAEVSRALGVSESYISQLLAEPDFKADLEKLRAARATIHSEIDDKYDKVEKTVVDRLSEIISTKVQLLPPSELLKIAKFANEAKRRHAPVDPSTQQRQLPTIVINLPSANIPQLQVVTSPNNEVLEIGGQSLVPMATKTLLDNHSRNKLAFDPTNQSTSPASSQQLTPEMI